MMLSFCVFRLGVSYLCYVRCLVSMMLLYVFGEGAGDFGEGLGA